MKAAARTLLRRLGSLTLVPWVPILRTCRFCGLNRLRYILGQFLRSGSETQDDLKRPHRDRTRTCAALTCASGLRSGTQNASASISKISPGCTFTPSEKDSVAVPKKCTCTSPGRRNKGYLK